MFQLRPVLGTLTGFPALEMLLDSRAKETNNVCYLHKNGLGILHILNDFAYLRRSWWFSYRTSLTFLACKRSPVFQNGKISCSYKTTNAYNSSLILIHIVLVLQRDHPESLFQLGLLIGFTQRSVFPSLVKG